MPLITILVPCYNEEQTLPSLYKALCAVCNPLQAADDAYVGEELTPPRRDSYSFEFLFINDGSVDNTLAIIKTLRTQDPRVCYVDLSRNFGKENAMLAGFDFAKGDAVIIIDADLQDPPTLIPEMLRIWDRGTVQDVYARRKTRGKESWMRKQLSLLFYRILDHTTRFNILQNVGDFRLLDKQAILALRQLRETERYTKGMYCWIGFRKQEIEFDRQDRVAGNSKWNFLSLLNLAIEGITSFTTAPLRFATYTGLITALGAFIYGLYYFIKALAVGDPVAGFPTLIIVILLLGGIQLITIGIIGEYLGRVFNEVKKRPVYLAQEYNGERQYTMQEK
ncbi:MAG: glycosyltransferase family 2 protein [Paludibacteraceae bacterium]